MKAGIYYFIINEKFAYVGQSIRLTKRMNKHLSLIHAKRHPNVDIDVVDLKMDVAELCNYGDLNKMELKWFNDLSKKYIMLNKIIPGFQKDSITMKVFDDGVDTNIFFNKDGICLSGKYVDKIDELFSLSELLDFTYKNSNVTIKHNDIMNSKSFFESSSHHYNIIIHKFNYIDVIKDKKLYKVIGKGENKKIYCDLFIWTFIAKELSSQLYAGIVVNNFIN